MVVDITVFFIISTFVTTLCEFEVDNPVAGKDIKEEKTIPMVAALESSQSKHMEQGDPTIRDITSLHVLVH